MRERGAGLAALGTACLVLSFVVWPSEVSAGFGQIVAALRQAFGARVNVDSAALNDGDVLQYDGTTGSWVSAGTASLGAGGEDIQETLQNGSDAVSEGLENLGTLTFDSGARVEVPAGSLAAPALRFSGGGAPADSGIIWDGVDSITIVDEGSAGLSVDGPTGGARGQINWHNNKLAGFVYDVRDRTIDGTLTSTHVVLTNIGATGTVTTTYNAVSGGADTAGQAVTVVRVADFPFRIKPAAGRAIIWSGGKMDDEEYLELGTVGSSVTLIANSDDDLMVVSVLGTVTEETP